VTSIAENSNRKTDKPSASLILSRDTIWFRRMLALTGEGVLFMVTSLSMLAVLSILIFVAIDAIPFFRSQGFTEFFTSNRWYPSRDPAEFGALSLFFGSAVVTTGAILFAVPVGVCAAVCLSDILPYSVREIVKPVVEILASIPSVAFGFFALVVFAPLLQDHGGPLLAVLALVMGIPVLLIGIIVIVELMGERFSFSFSSPGGIAVMTGLLGGGGFALYELSTNLWKIHIQSGTNVLNVSLILGVMALPTIVSVSEDALQAVGKELRMAAYGLGSTRSEMLLKVVLPAASSGILAAVILGIMRAVGETMVVWMASGNAAQIPAPWYDITAPIRTLTATIAGDMGEADQVTGSDRYHVLFALALCLLLFSFVCNLVSEWVIKKNRARLKGE
jgi:phosphate transport system permease protein